MNGDIEKANDIWETAKVAKGYFHLKSMVSIGFTVNLSEVPFEKAMVYSWIEESKNVRKN